MKSRLFCFTAFLALLTVTGFAQQKKFSSTKDAVNYISEMCTKYWLRDKMEGEISRDITVYQHGFQLFFNEKSILKGKDNNDNNEVHTILTSINLEQAKQAADKTIIEITGNNKDIVTVSYHGNSELNNKGEFSKVFRLPLDYNNQMLRDNMTNLTNAVDYLLKECYTKACRIKN